MGKNNQDTKACIVRTYYNNMTIYQSSILVKWLWNKQITNQGLFVRQ